MNDLRVKEYYKKNLWSHKKEESWRRRKNKDINDTLRGARIV
jgi:hypothetical protein